MAKGKLEPIPHPRRMGEAARAIVDLLAEHKVRGARFFKNKHARVEFEFGGKPIVFHFSCTPRAPAAEAKRACREISDLMGVPR